MADHFYWLISAPRTPQDTFQTVVRKTSREHSYATNYIFEVPDLKVGTLDSLMMLSDDLAKIDAFVENTTKKIVRQLTDIDKKPEKGESLTVSGSTYFGCVCLSLSSCFKLCHCLSAPHAIFDSLL
jgi:V-type H+-transporting ATPase subunit C